MCVHFPQQIFCRLHKSKEIENRQHLVNMKAVGVVVMTESAIIYRDPGKPHTVALYSESCIHNISSLRKPTSMNTLRT